MAEVDYGYGEQFDYGYGDAEPDMIAEDTVQPSYYTAPAEANVTNDYGYGDGDVNMSSTITTGSSSCSNRSLDQSSTHIRRPKRRCSVTKFTLESGDAPTSLTAASVIANMRNGIVPSSQEQEGVVMTNTDVNKENYDTSTHTKITPENSTDFDLDMMNEMEKDGSDDNGIDLPNSTDSDTKKRSGMFRLLSLKRPEKK